MTNSDLSRRSIAKGATWGLPALTIAAAAPAMAASPVITVKGSSNFTDTYLAGTTTSTIDAWVRPADPASFSVTNGPAVVTNLSMTYWLPARNFVFSPTASTVWSTLASDSSKAAIVGPNTGLTYYPYTTTYTGTSSPVSSGPTYSFKAPRVTVSGTSNPGGAYFYQFSYSLNGTARTNPRQAINNP